MTITIRLAGPKEVHAIVELIGLKAIFDGVPNSVEATAEKLLATLFSDPPPAQVLLAEVEDEAVGMASFHHHYSTFLARPGIWLDDLFVKDAYRSRGVGEALVTRLSQICVKTGGGRIEWSVAARNLRGIQFYERIGATVLQGSRLARLNPDAVIRLAARDST